MGVFYVRSKAGTGTEFSWVRFVSGLGILALLVIAAILTAGDPDLRELHTTLLAPIETLLGAIVGMVVGESISR